jgi:hypothetical protein
MIYPILQLHPLVRASIEAQGQTETSVADAYRCGCHHRGIDRMWLCPYHQGFDDGIEAAQAAEPRDFPDETDHELDWYAP